MKRLVLLTVSALIIASFAMSVQADHHLAELQVIHNAADPLADTVDVYVNGELFLPSFAFRTATPFVEVPAGVTLTIGVALGPNSTAADIAKEFDVVLEGGNRYVVMANGVLGGGFSPNPDGMDIEFSLFPQDEIRTKGWGSLIRLIAFHGVTDAPTVDVAIKSKWGTWPIFNDLTYGEFSSYRLLWPAEYELVVTPGNDNSTVVASYTADLTGLAGGAAVVFASGFLAPAPGQPAFGLYVALPDGTAFPLPSTEQLAEIQLIHNAADPAAAVVDIYKDGLLLVPGFAFRTATPFVELPAGVPMTIGVAPGPGSSAGDIIAEFELTLEANERYVAIANGVLGGGFAPNPDGESIAFTVFTQDRIRDKGYGRFVTLKAFHGVTDAPTVDITISGWWGNFPLFDNLTYGEFSSYRYLFPLKYTLGVTPGNDNSTIVAAYEADLRGLYGGSAVAFASGFLSPAPGEPAFGLFVALPDGQVIALPPATVGPTLARENAGALIPEAYSLSQNYPNPFNPSTTIRFSIPNPSQVSLKVYNMLGQEVETLLDGNLEAGEHSVNFKADRLASGVYFYRLNAGEYTDTRKMLFLK